MLAPVGGLAPPPRENPRSATVVELQFFTILIRMDFYFGGIKLMTFCFNRCVPENLKEINTESAIIPVS